MNKASATSDAGEGGLADEDVMSENGDVTQSFEQIEQVKEEVLDIAGTDEMRADNLKVEKRRISLEPEEGETPAEPEKTDEGGRSSLLQSTNKNHLDFSDVIVQNITIDAQPDVAQKNSPADQTPEVSPPEEFEEVDFVDEFDEPVDPEETEETPEVNEETKPPIKDETPKLKEETKPPIKEEVSPPKEGEPLPEIITPTQIENPEVTPIAIETPTQDEESAPKKKKDKKKKKKDKKKKKKKKRKNSESTQV